MDNALQQQARTERIVRMEIHRRHAKGTMRVIDNMIHEVDNQLMYVAQFKKEWLQHQRKCEEARQKLVKEEASVRAEVMKEGEAEMKGILKLSGHKRFRKK